MPYIQYIPKNFKPASAVLIQKANDIIEEYQQQGFSLTLRQLYYQFVARDILPNTMRSYKNLGTLVNNARLAGLIDWDSIEDRTRNVKSNPHWNHPSEIIDSCVRQFAFNKWANQHYAPEVWIEKEALIGVIERTCRDNDVPYFACRGYSSQSEQWRAGRRFEKALQEGRTPIVFHLGDHDPSGIDMTRDNADRLTMFAQDKVIVKRLALNSDQVDQYDPPPNPAKLTDSRAKDYIANYGYSSWELDALEPSVINALILKEINEVRDDDIWEQDVEREDVVRQRLRSIEQELSGESF